MKIRTQFSITIILFSAILVAVGASLIITNRQVERIQKHADIAHKLELAARELSYMSNEYLLYGESQQRTRWEARFSSFSDLLSGFAPQGPEALALANNINENRKRLNAIFTDIASTLENRPLTGGGAADMAMIRVSWSRMEVQNQGMAFDASRLSRMLEEQASRLEHQRVILLFVLIGVFGGFLVINYGMVNRRILQAISDLQAGIKIIGSGNLEFAIEEKKADEIGDLSRAFNRMTADLKVVTASKADLEQEMSERKQAEEALRESRAKLEAALSSMTDAVFISDVQGRFINCNDAFATFHRFRSEDECAKTFAEYADTLDVLMADGTPAPPDMWAVPRALRGETVTNAEYTLRRKDTGETWVGSYSFSPIRDKDGAIVGSVVVGRDITERKQAEAALRASEERLKASLVEKEVLLMEIHHRVKNNMQVISSLVSLQANQSQDAAIRDVLQDVSHRVRSMALVHEKLYQSADLARVEFDEYARSLLSYLWRAHATMASGVRLDLDLMPVSLSVNEAVPCGLILNELVGNALKHAFCGRTGGRVAVSLRGGAQGQVRLCVSDNGNGLPAAFDWRQARSLGLHLVQMLAAQLHADVQAAGDGGTEFTITFAGPKS